MIGIFTDVRRGWYIYPCHPHFLVILTKTTFLHVAVLNTLPLLLVSYAPNDITTAIHAATQLH